MNAFIEIAKDILGWFFRLFVRPSLRIEYVADGEPQVETVSNADPQAGWFYRLRVWNDGRLPAQDCTATLSRVEPQAGGRSLERPATLKWAHEDDYQPITIESKESRKLDLAFLLENDPRLHFYFQRPSRPAGIDREFPVGSYRVMVRVSGKNAVSTTAWFSLEASAVPGSMRIFKIQGQD